MNAYDFFTEDELDFLHDWFSHGPSTRNKQCKAITSIGKKIYKRFRNKYCSKTVYRGIYFDGSVSLAPVDTIFAGGKLTPNKPCESWTTDEMTAVSVSKQGSIADKIGFKEQPMNDVGLVFERESNDWSCLLPIPLLFNFSWDDNSRYDVMIDIEKQYKEEEIILKSTPLRLKNVKYAYIHGDVFRPRSISYMKDVTKHIHPVLLDSIQHQYMENYKMFWVDLFFKKGRIVKQKVRNTRGVLYSV